MGIDIQHKYNTIIERSKPVFKQVKSCSLETNEQVRNLDSKVGISVRILEDKIYKIIQRDKVLSPLIDYAKSINSQNTQAYYNAFNCGKAYEQNDNTKLKQLYRCGSRLCNLCCNIRSEQLSDKLIPMLLPGEVYVHLTLTKSNTGLSNVLALETRLNEDNKQFTKIKDNCRKQGIVIDAVMCLEVIPPTYKRRSNGSLYYADFHPHYHCFTTLKCALKIVELWLKMNPTALEINQKIRVLDPNNLRKEIREIIKYSIKATIPTKDGKAVNLKGVDEIFTLMKGKRRLKTWGAFYDVGKIETIDIEELDLKAQVYNDLPLNDTGEMVDMYDYRGKFIKQVPAFKRTLIIEFCQKRLNYFYFKNKENELQLTFFEYGKKSFHNKFTYVDTKYTCYVDKDFFIPIKL